MTQRLMRGATALRYPIAKYLSEAYPPMRLNALRSWTGMTAVDLPSIEEFNPTDLTGIITGAKPTLGVEVQRAQEFARNDMSALAEEMYQPKYTVRILFYLYSQSDDSGVSVPRARTNAIRQRDDNMAILRACLLSRPSLGTDFLYLNERTYTEDYLIPVPTPNNSQRIAIGGQITVDVACDEMQAYKALNDPTKPNEMDVTVEVIDPDDPAKYFRNLGRMP